MGHFYNMILSKNNRLFYPFVFWKFNGRNSCDGGLT